MKASLLKPLAIILLFGLLTACGETFTGTYHGKLKIINPRGCNGGRSDTIDISVVARIDGDTVTLRPYSEEKQSMQDISKLEAKFSDSLNFNVNNVSTDKMNQFNILGRGDFSQDRDFLSFSIQITKPEYDSTTDAPSTTDFCKETYEVTRAQLEQ